MKRQPLGNIENRPLLENRDAEDLSTLLGRLELEAKQRRSPCKPLQVRATQDNEIKLNECASREKKRLKIFIAAHTLTNTDNNLYFIVALTNESERNLNRGEILIGSPEKAKFRSKDYRLIKITPDEFTEIKEQNTRKELRKERKQQQQNNENQSTLKNELERYINSRLEEINLAQQEKYQEQNLKMQSLEESAKDHKMETDSARIEGMVILADHIIAGNKLVPSLETHNRTLSNLKKIAKGTAAALCPALDGIEQLLEVGCTILFGQLISKAYEKTYAKRIPNLFKDYLKLLKVEPNKPQEIKDFLTTSTEYTSQAANYSGNYRGQNILLTCLQLINLKCIGKESTIDDLKQAAAEVKAQIAAIKVTLEKHNKMALIGSTLSEQEPYMDKFLKCINFIASVFEYGNGLAPMSDQGNSPTDSSEAEESNSESEVVEPRESQMDDIEAGGDAETNQNNENIVARPQTTHTKTQPAAPSSPLAQLSIRRPRPPADDAGNRAPEATVNRGNGYSSNSTSLFNIANIVNCDNTGPGAAKRNLWPS
jgi:hypothetical protein